VFIGIFKHLYFTR